MSQTISRLAKLACCLLMVPQVATAAGSGSRWVETEKLRASDGGSGDEFGEAMALSEETLLVGAALTGAGAGSVYSFDRQPDGSWVETQSLAPSDAAFDQWFGYSVALDDGIALVGARRDSELGSDAGAAYLFAEDPTGVWVETQKLTASDGGPLEWFGNAVAISGPVAVVGAPLRDDLGFDSGAVYVFEQEADDSWREVQKLVASDGSFADHFGDPVVLVGDVMAVGAPLEDLPEQGAGAVDAGAVYIFERQAEGRWSEVQRLTASAPVPREEFGSSIALTASTLVVGAVEGDAAYVFELRPDGWVETQRLVASDGSIGEFGYSVATDEETLVVGARHELVFDGAAYVFERDGGGGWVETQKVVDTDGFVGGRMGSAVAVAGETLFLGEPRDGEDGPAAGAVHGYTLRGCDLDLVLESDSLHAGESLRLVIDLEHRRDATVTVPIRLWIEDAAGEVVLAGETRRLVLSDGDVVQRTISVQLPAEIVAGKYSVLIGVDEMEQGVIWAERAFRILD